MGQRRVRPARARSGRRIDPAGAAFFTDASVLAPAMGGIPVLILGPGEPTMAHKTDEYRLVSNIEAAVGLYTEIGRPWMGCRGKAGRGWVPASRELQHPDAATMPVRRRGEP